MSKRSTIRGSASDHDYTRAEKEQRAYLACELHAVCVASAEARQYAIAFAAEDGVKITAVDLATAERYLERCLRRMSLPQLCTFVVEEDDGSVHPTPTGMQRLAAQWSAGAQGARRWRLEGGAAVASESQRTHGNGKVTG